MLDIKHSKQRKQKWTHRINVPNKDSRIEDNPEFRDIVQNDEKQIGRLTSQGQCTIGRGVHLHKWIFTLQILTPNQTGKEL